MNYITQIKEFWIAQEANQLSTNEVALYFYLLEVNNKLNWNDTFKRNNAKISADLSMSFKTMQQTRNKLQQVGLIQFKTQNGNPNASYQIVELGKNSNGSGEGNGRGLGEGLGGGIGRGLGRDKINQTKPNQTSSNSHSGAAAPAKKNEIEFWDLLVKAWFDFYEQKFSAKPIFNATQASFLKKIVIHLKKVSLAAGKEWTENYANKCLNGFLIRAWDKDEWMRKNFELSNLLSKINSITHYNGTTTTESKQNRRTKSSGALKIAHALAAETGLTQ